MEGRAFAHFAFQLDPTLVLLDDAIDGREAEAGSLAEFLRRKKRLEDALQIFRRNAFAGVRVAEADEFPRRGLDGFADVGGVHVARGNADGQPSAARHRIARIHREVQQNLLDHRRVGLDNRRLAVEMNLQRDVLAEQPAEHFLHAADHAVQIQRTRIDDLLAAKREQLPRQTGGAFGGLLDLVRRDERLRFQRRHRQQRRVTEDDGEDVVKIMRHAASELADGFHFLRLAQLFFQPLMQRDVAEQAQ